MATTVNLIRRRKEVLGRPIPGIPLDAVPQDEAWWREEVGIEVEHEVWHLPQLAEEEQQSQA